MMPRCYNSFSLWFFFFFFFLLFFSSISIQTKENSTPETNFSLLHLTPAIFSQPSYFINIFLGYDVIEKSHVWKHYFLWCENQGTIKGNVEQRHGNIISDDPYRKVIPSPRVSIRGHCRKAFFGFVDFIERVIKLITNFEFLQSNQIHVEFYQFIYLTTQAIHRCCKNCYTKKNVPSTDMEN